MVVWVQISTLLRLEDICRHGYNNYAVTKRSWLETGDEQRPPVLKSVQRCCLFPSIHLNLLHMQTSSRCDNLTNDMLNYYGSWRALLLECKCKYNFSWEDRRLVCACSKPTVSRLTSFEASDLMEGLLDKPELCNFVNRMLSIRSLKRRHSFIPCLSNQPIH